jgi:hypothetical protein
MYQHLAQAGAVALLSGEDGAKLIFIDDALLDEKLA